MPDPVEQPNITPAEPATTNNGDSLLTDSPKAVDENSEQTLEAEETTTDEGAETDADKEGDESDSPVTDYQDFTVPEGMQLDTELLEQAKPLFKEAGLSQEMAQKFVELQAGAIEKANGAGIEAYNRQMEEWQTQSKNDKEFGGEKFEESIATARIALDKLGTPELTKVLDDVGVGNHPEMIRFMMKVGRQLKEDVPGSALTTGNAEKDRVTTMYPTEG